ncbi:hypothetical protein [Amycolatopsis sp. cmx-4-54]|uniref:hypothetical protein n=1 Tax=Amycolatopsis sp. cmx-4-54 TaxID=2790936 RepID=UPI00397AC3C8
MTAGIVPSELRTTVRLAAREVREAAFRALLAAGASGGEGAAAAEAVLWAEAADGSGVASLLEELARVRVKNSPVHLERTSALAVLSDGGGRGPMLLGPLAADLAVAIGQPVFSPGTTSIAVMEAVARTAAMVSGSALAVLADGSRSLAVPDGRVFRAADPTPFPAPDGMPGVILFKSPGTPEDGVELGGLAEAAMANGLRVAAEPWAVVYAASRRFLVPES